MNRKKVAERLLWKDAMTIRSLLIAVVVGIMLLQTAVWLFNENTSNHFAASVLIWFLMPNLMALGAPALLIGSEEEQGTLNWLRTLPVRWQAVYASKLTVAVGSLVVAWIISSAALAISLAAAGIGTHPKVWSSVNANYLTWNGFIQLFWFSIVLILCGFVTAYRFRSPVTALIVVVPLVTLVAIVFNTVTSSFAGTHGDPPMATHPTDFAAATLVYVVAIAIVLALWWIQRRFAYRRLEKPARARPMELSSGSTSAAYRPPSSLTLQRPSMMRALMWQQWRQIALAGGLLIITAVVFLVLSIIDHQLGRRNTLLSAAASFSILVVPAAFLWLGTLTFYGDSARQQFRFFADRGISRTAVWWTRMVPTLVLTSFLWLLVTLALVFNATMIRDVAGPVAGLIALFAIGQLISQWPHRPALAFFAAPVVAACCAIHWSIVFTLLYPTYVATIGFVVPVLLFASWRLASYWLIGRKGFSYHCRAVAYLALAIGLPLGYIVLHRYATTPPPLDQWRQQMLASPVPQPPSESLESEHANRAANDRHAILPPAMNAYYDYHNQPWDPNLQTRLEQELQATDPLGTHVSYNDIGSVMGLVSGTSKLEMIEGERRIMRASRPWSPSSDPKMRQLWRTAIEVLLSWAQRSREQLAEGRHGLAGLLYTAERSEALATSELAKAKRSYDDSFATDVEDLISKIPSDELRRHSRRVTFQKAWQRYQHSQPNEEVGSADKYFGHYPILPPEVSWIGIERRRSDRLLDYAVRDLLAQVENDRFFDSQSELEAWQELWGQASDGPRWEAHDRSAFGNEVEGMARKDAIIRQLRGEQP